MIAACGDAKLMPFDLSAETKLPSTASAWALGARAAVRLSNATNRVKPASRDCTGLGERTGWSSFLNFPHRDHRMPSPEWRNLNRIRDHRVSSVTFPTRQGHSALAFRTSARNRGVRLATPAR